jgi:4-amino-4-deoxychorismate lyase
LIRYMCRLFESIKVLDGVLLHLEYHQERVSRSRRELFGYEDTLDLAGIPVPPECRMGLFKLKVTYKQAVISVNVEPYSPRPVRSLKLIYAGSVDYKYKYEERSVLNALFRQRGDCDDILIVKGGRITDTSYSNIAFLDGDDWVTPVNPLLKGTCRARLIAGGILRQAEIKPADLSRYSRATLINAMLEPGQVIVDIGSIR